MKKYIDADELKRSYAPLEGCLDVRTLDGAKKIFDAFVDGMPAADVVEVRNISTKTIRIMLDGKELHKIDLAPAADALRWIPVTERLPEKYGQYLVTFIPSGGTLWAKVLIVRYSDLMGIAKPSFHIGEVGKDSFVNINEQVIAWMPLPEPYKGGEKE